jgi:hypothetical protein
LRTPGVGADKPILRKDTRFQKQKEEPIHLPVSAAPPDSLHDLMVGKIIETALDIALYNPGAGKGMPLAFCRFPRTGCPPDML